MPLQKRIAETPALYRLILDHALDAYIAIDEHDAILEWSKQAEEIFGWTRDDVLHTALADTIIPTRYRTAHLEGLARYLQTGEHKILGRRIEMTARRKDGREIPIELAITPLPGTDQRLFSASLRDVSRQKALEKELRNQASITSSILESMADAVIVTDLSGRIIMINAAGQRLMNLPPNEQVSEQSYCAYQLFKPDGKTLCPHDERPATRAIQGEHVNGWIGAIRNDALEQEVWVSINARPLIDADGTRIGAVMLYHDITELHLRERALAQHARLLRNYRMVVESSTEFAIIVTDPEGIIVNWNIGAEKILGVTAQEAIGQSIAQIFTPEDQDMGQAGKEMEKARDTGRAEDIRWHIRKDGSRFWANGVVMPLWNDDGSLHGFTKIMRDQTEQRLADEKAHFLAHHDVLTGLPNRVHFSDHLHKSILASNRSHLPFALLLMDMDRFKLVNDTCGHHAGDLLLKEVARRILSTLRETDFVARLGGDEFVVIQNDVSQPHAAETLAQKLVAELGRPYQLDEHEVATGASIGIGTYPTDANNVVELLKRADLALYHAKSVGRGTFQVYTPDLLTEQNWKRDREQRLRNALINGEFVLYYQPEIDLQNWKVSTVEALLRWQVSDMEQMQPSEFLELAEQSGLIVEIGEWAVRSACRQLKQWQENGMPDLRISLNCSARQFSDPEFVAKIGPILEETGIDSSCLDLELSESMLARPEIKEQLAALRALGVRITIDNFGTGTMAIVDLKEFEVDNLKIDNAVVQHLPHREKDVAMTSSIISMAHNFGLGVTAGGVETAEQLAYLRSRNCNGAQGFIFSPPVPAKKFEELMLSDHWSRINRLPSLSDAMVFKNLY